MLSSDVKMLNVTGMKVWWQLAVTPDVKVYATHPSSSQKTVAFLLTSSSSESASFISSELDCSTATTACLLSEKETVVTQGNVLS